MPVNKCENCGLDFTLYPSLDQKTCSGCNTPLGSAFVKTPEPEFKNAEDFFKGNFKKVSEICKEPTLFFTRNQSEILAKTRSVNGALFFAVIIHWFAAFFNYIWKSMGLWFSADGFSNFFHLPGDVKFRFLDFFIGAGSIILSPFITVFSLFVSALLIHIGTWALKIEKREFTATLKILSFASAPWVFCVIPGVGVVVAYVYSFIITVIGIKTVYEVSNVRALMAVLFPKFMWIILAMAALSFIMVAALLGIGVGVFSGF